MLMLWYCLVDKLLLVLVVVLVPIPLLLYA
nr:hypothetical protein Q903MT_gene3241 [Picea sitchensis]